MSLLRIRISKRIRRSIWSHQFPGSGQPHRQKTPPGWPGRTPTPEIFPPRRLSPGTCRGENPCRSAYTGSPPHNKTLAAQLYGEFKEFFPNNAVEFFVFSISVNNNPPRSRTQKSLELAALLKAVYRDFDGNHIFCTTLLDRVKRKDYVFMGWSKRMYDSRTEVEPG